MDRVIGQSKRRSQRDTVHTASEKKVIRLYKAGKEATEVLETV